MRRNAANNHIPMKKTSTHTVAALTVLATVLSYPAATSAEESPRYASRLIEYRPAPGQFVNLDITLDSTAILGPVSPSVSESPDDAMTTGVVSLGSFGGYIIIAFDQPVENNPNNPYGVDFTIFGNAMGTGSSCEPAAVQVMKDLNGNGIPDDGPWYELAGSDYWLSSTRHNISMTYFNPGYNTSHAVTFTTSDGTSGAIQPVAAHTQPYYPDPYMFAGIPADSYTLTGNIITGAPDLRNPKNISLFRVPAFGYADTRLTPAEIATTTPRNPYRADNNGAPADGFDISWAVDTDGNHVDLDQIDFIRIYTAMSANMGWLGEISPEIAGIAATKPDPGYVHIDQYIHYIGATTPQVIKGTTTRIEGLLFKNGRPCSEGEPNYTVADPEIGTIDNQGNFTALKDGKTTISFTQTDKAEPDQIEICVTTLTGVGIDLNGTASAAASTKCTVGEKLFIPVVSLDNGKEAIPGVTGNRFTGDTYNWYNSNPKTGIVDQHGTFTALAKGSTVLTAESKTDPSLYAEIKITVTDISPATLRTESIAIAAENASGILTSNNLFRTSDRSTVFINKATARNGLLPLLLKGNRIIYDCSNLSAFSDILDLETTHHGQTATYSIPVEFAGVTSGAELTISDNCTTEPTGNLHIYTLSGTPVSASALTPGIYIVRRGNHTTKLLIRP